ATLLLLPTLPFRKLWALVVGTSGAPTAATTAGSGGALAAKVLALTAIGSTAVGVTVKEGNTPPSTPTHSPAPPAAPGPGGPRSGRPPRVDAGPVGPGGHRDDVRAFPVERPGAAHARRGAPVDAAAPGDRAGGIRLRARGDRRALHDRGRPSARSRTC